MEDQQPAASDLTDETPDTQSEDGAAVETDSAATDDTAADSVDGEPGETAADDEAGTDAAENEAEEGRPARRRVGRWVAVAVGVAAALFVGSAAFAGAAVQPYLVDRATVNTKLQIARTAANAITTLWTYTPDNMDKLADRSAQYLSGDFEAQYRKYIDAIAAPNKQAQITNNTQVTGAAVESLNDPNATAIVYTNSTSTSPLTKNIPSLKYVSYRLQMKRDHSRWFVTKMSTITSLDLTPQL
ncbi:mammalian cell entry protein [Mycobacterium kyorinense]|uniref:Mammalian cell entry protein n=1 Tax=Mycobacterium kyorinense TaxID=487514 RepID=A0A1A2Z5Z6_9MYCO|nr:mammalian cell entry protein [Mycobacterium kyorinense]OBI45979.1 mammalian cell entry protein [Mycobacterium kyorinense]